MSAKEKNSIELLLMDLNFRDWVISPKPETERYWKTWLKNNPDKKAEFLFANELIQNLLRNKTIAIISMLTPSTNSGR